MMACSHMGLGRYILHNFLDFHGLGPLLHHSMGCFCCRFLELRDYIRERRDALAGSQGIPQARPKGFA